MILTKNNLTTATDLRRSTTVQLFMPRLSLPVLAHSFFDLTVSLHHSIIKKDGLLLQVKQTDKY